MDRTGVYKLRAPVSIPTHDIFFPLKLRNLQISCKCTVSEKIEGGLRYGNKCLLKETSRQQVSNGRVNEL